MEAHCSFWASIWGDPEAVGQIKRVCSLLRGVAREQPQLQISEGQFQAVLSSLPRSKAADASGVTYESLVALPASFHLVLLATFNSLLQEVVSSDACLSPKHWQETMITLLAKHPRAQEVRDYRPIALSNIIAKFFSRLLLQWVQEPLIQMPCWIMGFRPRYATTHAISSLFLMAEKTTEWDLPMGVLRLDVQKAYDNVSRVSLLEKLQRVLPAAVLLGYAYLFTQRASIRWGDLCSAEPIDVQQGCPQGDPSSPALFALLTSELLQPVWDAWREVGLCSWGHAELDPCLLLLGLLLYADDILIVAKGPTELMRQLQDVVAALAGANLQISEDKCALACNAAWTRRWGNTWAMGSRQLVADSQIHFLGTIVRMDARAEPSVDANLRKAQLSVWRSASQLHQRSVSLKKRMQLLQALVAPVVLYACEAWIMSRGLASKIERFHLACLRWLLRVRRRRGESWVDWLRRSTHWARAARRRFHLKPWLLMALQRQHRWWAKLCGGSSLPAQVLAWRDLAWWRLAQAMKVKHPRRFGVWRWEAQFALNGQDFPSLASWEGPVSERESLWVQQRLFLWELHDINIWRGYLLLN